MMQARQRMPRFPPLRTLSGNWQGVCEMQGNRPGQPLAIPFIDAGRRDCFAEVLRAPSPGGRQTRIVTAPARQWRQLLSEGGAGRTKTYVMEFDNGCLVQVLCSDEGTPIASTLAFVPGASLSDFGRPED